jgi:hypothetical protein
VTDQRPFHPAEIIEVLRRHDVEYGALAALAQGVPIPVTADTTCASDPAKNLERLSAAVDELEAGPAPRRPPKARIQPRRQEPRTRPRPGASDAYRATSSSRSGGRGRTATTASGAG